LALVEILRGVCTWDRPRREKRERDRHMNTPEQNR
jgi:hypothetical protein